MTAYLRVPGSRTVLEFTDVNGPDGIAGEVKTLMERGVVVRFNGGAETVILNFGAAAAIEVTGEDHKTGRDEMPVRATVAVLSSAVNATRG